MSSGYVVLTALLWHEDDQWVSKCQELGIASCGDTEHEALENLIDATNLHVETLAELGVLEDELRRRSVEVRRSKPKQAQIQVPIGVHVQAYPQPLRHQHV